VAAAAVAQAEAEVAGAAGKSGSDGKGLAQGAPEAVAVWVVSRSGESGSDIRMTRWATNSRLWCVFMYGRFVACVCSRKVFLDYRCAWINWRQKQVSTYIELWPTSVLNDATRREGEVPRISCLWAMCSEARGRGWSPWHTGDATCIASGHQVLLLDAMWMWGKRVYSGDGVNSGPLVCLLRMHWLVRAKPPAQDILPSAVYHTRWYILWGFRK